MLFGGGAVMTKRQEQALKTKDKILKEAAKMVAENGVDNLNVDVLTERCGVAKGTFYTYFKHKEDVVFEICRDLFAQIEERMQQMTDKNIIEKLSYYFDEFMNEVERYGVNITRAWIRGVIDPNNAPANFDNRKWQYDVEMLENILKNAVKSKDLKKNTPVELLTHIIISQLYGMMTVWCMSDCEFEPKEWTEKFCDIQLKAILEKYLV